MPDHAQTIFETDERFVAAFNTRDLDTLVSMYTEDAVIMPPGSPEIFGRSAIRAFLEELLDVFDVSQQLNNTEVEVAGDWAFMRGQFELVVQHRESGDKLVERGKHLVIWRKQADGTWQAARDMWNSSEPAFNN